MKMSRSLNKRVRNINGKKIAEKGKDDQQAEGIKLFGNENRG